MGGEGSFDKNKGESIYSRIVGEVLKNIESGELKYGAKLPTERELAATMNVSRGTVKKAYAELEKRGVVSIVWGSGAYITGRGIDEGPDENGAIQEFISIVKEKNYSLEEAKIYGDIKLQKAFASSKVNIAFVDNCPETLIFTCKQIESIKGAYVKPLLYDEVKRFKHSLNLLSEYDLVVTSERYYELLLEADETLEKKLLRINLSPEKETGINLLNILDITKVGLLSKSRDFRDIVNTVLAKSNVRIMDKDHILEKWAGVDEFSEFIKNKLYLILPPMYTLDLKPEIYEEIFRFIRGGGTVFTFNYGPDKSSIHYIDERIGKMRYSLNDN